MRKPYNIILQQMRLLLGETRHASEYWFKHILFRRKGLGAAYNATMPSPESNIGEYWRIKGSPIFSPALA